MSEKHYTPLEHFPPVTAGEDSIITEHRNEHLAAVELYTGVASNLSGWTFQQEESDRSWYGPTYRYKLVDSAGHAIALEFGKYHVPRGKVHVSGYWPRKGQNGYTSPADVRESSPSINVSLDRGHAAIARQITTRFLPEYMRVFALILARIAADDDYSARKSANWKSIVDRGLVIDARISAGGNECGELRIGTKGPNGWNYGAGYGNVFMSSADSVQIELRSLPIETAIRVLAALKGEK